MRPQTAGCQVRMEGGSMCGNGAHVALVLGGLRAPEPSKNVGSVSRLRFATPGMYRLCQDVGEMAKTCENIGLW